MPAGTVQFIGCIKRKDQFANLPTQYRSPSAIGDTCLHFITICEGKPGGGPNILGAAVRIVLEYVLTPLLESDLSNADGL